MLSISYLTIKDVAGRTGPQSGEAENTARVGFGEEMVDVARAEDAPGERTVQRVLFAFSASAFSSVII